MLYPNEIIEEVRYLNDIVDVVGGFVALRSRGGRHFGLCPFHREKTPSFSVNPEMQIFKCFGCGAGGNVFSFIMQIENYDFIEALKYLADRVNYALPQNADSRAAKNRARLKETLVEINRSAARFFYDYLRGESPEALYAREYLRGRNVSDATAKKFGLGLAPDGWEILTAHLTSLGHKAGEIQAAGLAVGNKTGGHYDRFRNRLIFPIVDITDKVVGFGGRTPGDKGEDGAKYLNSPETPLFEKGRQLYGLNIARKARASEIILVEGYMDVLGLQQAGFKNAAGALGTALTPDHGRLLKRVNCGSVILIMDSDEAGEKAALRAIPILLDSGLSVKVLQVKDAKDPDEYITKHGPGRFAALLKAAQSHVAFRINIVQKKHPIDTTEGRVAFTKEAAALLSQLPGAIEADAYAAEISAQTGISQTAIRAEIESARQNQAIPGAFRQISRRTAGLRQNDKGIQNARRGLICLLANDIGACKALDESGNFMPEEMGDPLYESLAGIIIQSARSGKKIAPADLINRFDSFDEQNKTADIFMQSAFYEPGAETEKALNEMAGLLKRAWIDKRISECAGESDESKAKLNSLFEEKRSLPSQIVNFSD
ncbi:MAG: DNA primase [Defluviitaleaceae bacterium]|nr:DNA primase [Defluviitaleaceae bacterium]